MFRDDLTWQRAVELADHFKAIGETQLYFSGRDDDMFPWHLVTSCEPGGTHRLDMTTSVTFLVQHPSGLMFRWSWDIEKRSANGKGHYEIDTDGLRRVLVRLPEAATASFRAYLESCIEPLEKRGREYDEAARQQYGTVHQLRCALHAKGRETLVTK